MADKCSSCTFRAPSSQPNKCDYILITGHSRGCEPGNLCTKYVQGSRIEQKKLQVIVKSTRNSDEGWLDKFTYLFN